MHASERTMATWLVEYGGAPADAHLRDSSYCANTLHAPENQHGWCSQAPWQPPSLQSLYVRRQMMRGFAYPATSTRQRTGVAGPQD